MTNRDLAHALTEIVPRVEQYADQEATDVIKEAAAVITRFVAAEEKYLKEIKRLKAVIADYIQEEEDRDD